jgi:energy-coupling factor transporter transmembrane protein EcfT
MNFQKVFWGIGLLLLGTFMLLEHLAVIHIHWWYLIHFWPVIIIIWGVSILPLKNNLKAIISIAIIIITILLVAIFSERRPEYFKNSPGIYFHPQNDNDDESDPPYFDADSSTTNI